ncbi:MAG: methyltransferase, partial [Planctomycetota bacterium]
AAKASTPGHWRRRRSGGFFDTMPRHRQPNVPPNNVPFKNSAYHLFHPVLRWVRSQPLLIRWLLGVRLPRGADVAFDPTTVLLARAARGLAKPEDESALEMGVGAGALVLLSLALDRAKRGQPIAVAGCDCVPRRVESARAVASHNGVDAEVFESDLFDAVPTDRRFDLILFNPPYVPTAVGEELRMGTRLTDERTMWDGGDDGLAVLRRFLAEAPAWLSPTGRVLFGVQHVFVSDEAVRRVIDASPMSLQQTYTRRSVPAEVYVVAPADRAGK